MLPWTWGVPDQLQPFAGQLDHLGLAWCLWSLIDLGVFQAGDVNYLTNEQLMLHIGLNLVQCQKVRAAAASATASCAATGGSRDAEVPRRRQEPPGQGAVEDETADIDAGLAREAEGARAAALRALASTASSVHHQGLRGLLAKAREHLAEGSPRSLGRALLVISRASAERDGQVLSPHGASGDEIRMARKRVAEALCWAVQRRTPLGDRRLFLAALETALDVAPGTFQETRFGDRHVQNLYAQLMQAHSKTVCEAFPEAFISNSKCNGLRRGKAREAARRDPDVEPPPGLELHACADAESDTCPLKELDTCPLLSLETCGPPPTSKEVPSDADVRPDRDSTEVDARSLPSSLGTGRRVAPVTPWRHRVSFAKAEGVIGPARLATAKPVVHPSGARTERDPDEDRTLRDLDEEEAPPHLGDGDEAARATARGLLVISELNQLLVWRDYEARHFKATPERTEDSAEMPWGHRLYFRPGSEALVASLLAHPDCTLAVACGMSHWHCLPSVRLLLERAAPGEWVVDEVLEGRWSCYGRASGRVIHTIEGGTLSSTSLEEQVDASLEEADEGGQPSSSWKKFFEEVPFVRHDDGSVSYRKQGVTHRGKLTADGLLVWTGDDGSEVWYRAGRSKPASLVRRSSVSGAGEQERVYVFSSDEWLEAFSVAASDAPVEAAATRAADRRIMKNLDKVWSGLRECARGSFDESNTILLDHSTDEISHPLNVVPVPRWRSFRQGDEMVQLRLFIEQLLVEKPGKVVDFLAAHPREDGRRH